MGRPRSWLGRHRGQPVLYQIGQRHWKSVWKFHAGTVVLARCPVGDRSLVPCLFVLPCLFLPVLQVKEEMGRLYLGGVELLP